MPLSPGQILQQRYRIVTLLGQGGFGAVYRAWDVNLNRPCAVKENMETTLEAQRQFMREATVLANLSHANLPRVIDHFHIPNQGQYLVMDFIEGEDLQEMLEKAGAPLPEEQVLDWMTQVCDALAYMHRQNPPIIHRDIKPANIKITPDGRAVLVDFGIAKIWDASMRTTQGARAVTPGFSPFEQYGQAPTDARSDVYGLGATAYALLTGQQPTESIARVAGAPLTPPCKINPHISPVVEQGILKAMEVMPANRWQSAGEFRDALAGKKSTPVKAPARQPFRPVAVTAPALVSSAPAVSAPARPKPAPAGSGRLKPGLLIGIGGVVLVAAVIVIVLALLPYKGAATVPNTMATSEPSPAIALTSGSVVPTTRVEATDGPVTLVIYNYGMDTDLNDLLTQMAKDYKTLHPNVTINTIIPASSNDINQLQVTLAAGEQVDIIAGIVDTTWLVENKYILDMETLGFTRNEMYSTYEDVVLQSVTYQDRIWSIPYEMSGLVLYINDDMIDPNRVPAYNDLQGFYDLAVSYHAETGGYLFCNPGLFTPSPIGAAYFLNPVFFGFGLEGYVDGMGEPHLTSTEALNAARWIEAIQPYAWDAPNDDWTEYVSAFQDNEVPIFWGGQWNYAEMFNGSKNITIRGMGQPYVDGIGLSITTQAYDAGRSTAAMEFSRYLAGADVQKYMASNLGSIHIPANTEALYSPEVQSIPGMSGFAEAFRHGTALLRTSYHDTTWDPVSTAISRIIVDGWQPEDALGAAQEQILAAIAGIK